MIAFNSLSLMPLIGLQASSIIVMRLLFLVTGQLKSHSTHSSQIFCKE